MAYTVLTRHGKVQDRGVTLAVAADMVMTYDGYAYEIMPDDDDVLELWISQTSDALYALDLWISQHSRNPTLGDRPMVRSTIRGETEDDIHRAVIQNAWWWSGQNVMTDEDYDAMIATQ